MGNYCCSVENQNISSDGGTLDYTLPANKRPPVADSPHKEDAETMNETSGNKDDHVADYYRNLSG